MMSALPCSKKIVKKREKAEKNKEKEKKYI
jgi:hypothetical protein